MGVPCDSVGFRGVSRSSLVPIAPFPIFLVPIFRPSDQYDAFRIRREVGFRGRVDGLGKCKEQKRDKRWIWGGYPSLFLFRQVPMLSILHVFPLSIVGASLFRAMR